MITFLLVEAEVELMPREIARHPKVVARAKKRRRASEQLLLDQAADHEAMRDLPLGDRRGRPDIAHTCLLLLMDSLLRRRGALRVMMHLRGDLLVRVRDDLRVPRSQAKSYQLFEDLLRQGEVPLGSPLLTLERGVSAREALRREAKGVKVLLDPAGEMARTGDFTALAREHEDVTLVLGAFPRGGYEGLAREDVDMVLRVADEPLSAWSALVPALAGFEDSLI